MTTQELKRMNNADFWQHISEASHAITRLRQTQNHFKSDVYLYFPELRQRCERKVEIAHYTANRLESWMLDRINERVVNISYELNNRIKNGN